MRWLAVLVAGFVAGAAAILLADPGTSEPRVITAPAGASDVNNTGLPGQHVHNGSTLSELQPDKPLDAATQDQLAAQLVEARTVAMHYPTVADALAAGYRLAGGFAPGSGAHYITYSGISGPGPLLVDHPLSLIYDGTKPTSRVIGLMYYTMHKNPQGFAGPNDHWHRHSGVCIKYSPNGIDVPFPADSDVTVKQCAGVHGQYMRTTGYMVHAWVVPGWESPQGVFSHNNPNVRCADGTYNTNKAGFCQGS